MNKMRSYEKNPRHFFCQPFYKLRVSYRELYSSCTWIVVRVLFSIKKVCMFLCVGTCIYSDVHVIAIFLCLCLFSCHDMNSILCIYKFSALCVYFCIVIFFHIILIMLYVYFSTFPHACTRIYDVHISCSIKNSRPGLLIILAVFQTVQ